MNGWFPHLNLDGAIASGDTSVWVDGVQVAAEGGGPIWAGRTLIYSDRVSRVNVGGGWIEATYNVLVGSDDTRWAGFYAPGQGRIDLYEGTTRTRSIDTGCSPRFAPGTFAFLAPYQQEYRALIVNDVVIARGPIMDLALGAGLVVWQEATSMYGRALLTVAGPCHVRTDEAPVAVFVAPDGTPWIVTSTHIGTLVRPLHGTLGYFIPGDLYYPDARMIGDRLRVVGSTGAGVPLFENWIDFTAPRVDLSDRTPVPPIEPPIEPPDPPDPGPEPPDPGPEPPIDPPVEPLPAPGPFRLATGVTAMSPIRVGLRLGQFFASVDRNTHPFPGWFGLKFTDTKPVEAFQIHQPQAGNPKLLIRPETVPGAALSADATEYSGDISSEFGVKPDVVESDWGGYEAWNGWQLGSDGISIVLVEYDRDGAKYASACLTVVKL